jgi:hypothetical protein
LAADRQLSTPKSETLTVLPFSAGEDAGAKGGILGVLVWEQQWAAQEALGFS